MTKVHFYNREGLYMGHSEIPDNTCPDVIQCGMFVFKRLNIPFTVISRYFPTLFLKLSL